MTEVPRRAVRVTAARKPSVTIASVHSASWFQVGLPSGLYG